MNFSPSLCTYLGLLWPKGNTLHLALLNPLRFTWTHLSSFPRPFWMTSLPYVVSTAPFSLVSSANLLRVHSIPQSRCLIKMLRSTSPKMDCCEKPLVRSFHPDIQPLTTSLWPWTYKQFFIHWTVHTSNPYLSNLCFYVCKGFTYT